MTIVEKSFSYYLPVDRNKLEAVGHLRTIYGIRTLSFDEISQHVSVEYDASRLSEDDVVSLFREAGMRLFSLITVAKQ
jgi:hypothetical protein